MAFGTVKIDSITSSTQTVSVDDLLASGDIGTTVQGTLSAGSGLDITSNTISFATTSNGYGTRTVSTSDPSGGSDGDIWLKVS